MAKIEATGNIGADAEVRFTKSGAPVLSFRMADSKSRKRPDDGEWEKVAEQWLSVSLWDDAEHYAPLLTKGTRVTVWGEFYAREYPLQSLAAIGAAAFLAGAFIRLGRSNHGSRNW